MPTCPMPCLTPNKNYRRKAAATLVLVFLAFTFCFYSCAPKAYQQLVQVAGNAACVYKFQPQFERALYRATVDVTGNHLSGILLIKQMPNSATRLLFTNEAGFIIFDFEFSRSGTFIVHSIVENMNKDAVKQTLKKDFQLILFNIPAGVLKPYRFKNQKEGEKYFAYHEGKDYYYYITNAECSQLLRMERGNSLKKVMEAYSGAVKDKVPDNIKIHHTNFNFDINLKRIYDNPE